MSSIFKYSLLLAAAGLATTTAIAGDVTKDAMKKFHKGEETVAKKAGAGEATPAELASLLKAYEDMAKDTPPKGTKGSWDTKVGALIEGVKKIQAGGTSGALKMAVACKACHDVHKGK